MILLAPSSELDTPARCMPHDHPVCCMCMAVAGAGSMTCTAEQKIITLGNSAWLGLAMLDGWLHLHERLT